MNDFLIPTLITISIGLMLLLVNTMRHIDQVNRIYEAKKTETRVFLLSVKYFIYVPILVLFAALVFYWQYLKSEENRHFQAKKAAALAKFDTAQIHEPPDPLSISEEKNGDLILYGRDLIARTADYLGPEGIVKPMSNGMNCQNCHLDAGSKPFGNNYMAVAATYPKFRARSGTAETIYKRVNDCFQRSLNGQALDSSSREMKAIEAYIRWVGQAVPKEKTPKGAGLMKVKFLNRAASPDSGQVVYVAKCQSCHGADGQGLAMPEGNGRRYPPLWGEKSYNEGAGLFRLSMFAGYVKANMPFGASYQNPQLSDAEAWDVAAFVNSQPRPKHPFLKTDWPKIAAKPFDHPFAPFADSFPEIQHKFGPFQPIVDWQKAQKKEGK
jgi:thiosulfate dehydrogenase